MSNTYAEIKHDHIKKKVYAILYFFGIYTSCDKFFSPIAALFRRSSSLLYIMLKRKKNKGYKCILMLMKIKIGMKMNIKLAK